MKVVVTGGGGYIGSSVAQRVLSLGSLIAATGEETPVVDLVLFDLNLNEKDDIKQLFEGDDRVSFFEGDIRDADVVAEALKVDPSKHSAISVFHLASILSGPGEIYFDLCLSVNIDGTRNLLESLRKIGETLGMPQKLVFTSTNAVFGPCETIVDDTPVLPQTTYGATKVICEKLVNDYTRKGFIIGSGARLPSVLIRTQPNKAASNCFSAVTREPLLGIDYECPVPLTTKHPCTSKKNVVNCLIKLHEMDNALLGIDKILLLPAVSYTLQEMYDRAKAFAEQNNFEKFGVLTEKIEENAWNIVKDWPPNVVYKRAEELGMPVEIDIDDLIQEFVDNNITNNK